MQSENKSGLNMAIMTQKKKEVIESILKFLKEGPKTIDEIVAMRKQDLKPGKKSDEKLRLDTFTHLSDLGAINKVTKVRTEEQTTYQLS